MVSEPHGTRTSPPIRAYSRTTSTCRAQNDGAFTKAAPARAACSAVGRPQKIEPVAAAMSLRSGCAEEDKGPPRRAALFEGDVSLRIESGALMEPPDVHMSRRIRVSATKTDSDSCSATRRVHDVIAGNNARRIGPDIHPPACP